MRTTPPTPKPVGGFRSTIANLFGRNHQEEKPQEEARPPEPAAAPRLDGLTAAVTPGPEFAKTPPTPGRPRKPRLGEENTKVVGDVRRETGLDIGKSFYHRITCGVKFYRAKLEIDRLNGEILITFQNEWLEVIGFATVEIKEGGRRNYESAKGRESILRDSLDTPLTIPKSTAEKTMRQIMDPGETPITITLW